MVLVFMHWRDVNKKDQYKINRNLAASEPNLKYGFMPVFDWCVCACQYVCVSVYIVCFIYIDKSFHWTQRLQIHLKTDLRWLGHLLVG